MSSDKLKKAVEFSNYRMTLNNQINILKSKSQSLLTYAKNGGTFYIDRTLMSFVDMLVRQDHESAVLLDINDNPIMVDNLEEFLEEIISRYFEVVNEFHVDYEKIRKSRSVKSILDLDV